jgi:hypothetical protein
MDGIYEMSGAPLVLTIGGKDLTFAPLDRQDHGTIELEIIKQGKSPLQVIKDFLPLLGDDDRRHLLELAYRDEVRGPMVSWYDSIRWQNTMKGADFVCWLRLKHNYPAITLEEASAIRHQIGWQDLNAYKASDGSPRGNFQSPDQKAGETKAGASPGDKSTEPSRNGSTLAPTAA